MLVKKLKIFSIYFFIASNFVLAFAQEQISFKHVKVEDGLSQSWIRTIYQDKQGFIWFGTEDGLNKYDGYSITNFYSDSRSNLLSNSINKISEDNKGNLWICTRNGLNIYDSEKHKFISKSFWPKSAVIDILQISESEFLLATSGDGLLLFDPDSGAIKTYKPKSYSSSNLSSYNQFDDIMSYVLSSIIKDKKGNIWIGTTKGLTLFDYETEKFKTYRKLNNDIYYKGTDNISSIYEDSKGQIWIGTRSNGLSLLKYNFDKTEKITFKRFEHNPENESSISYGNILSFCEDNYGYLWIGTENGGLNRLKLSQIENGDNIFEHYVSNPYNTNSISSNSISSLFKDKNGCVWIGTRADGVSYYHPSNVRFHHIKQLPNNPNSLNDKFINCFLDEENKLWIGTENGLNLLDKSTGRYKHFMHNPQDKNTLGSNAIQTIYRDSKNNLWIGSWGGGLSKFIEKQGRFIQYKHDEENTYSISNNNVSSIVETSNGELWISTMGGGINIFDTESGHFKTFNRSTIDNSRVTNNWVNTLYKDGFGLIWISTSSAVNIYDTKLGVFKNLSSASSESSNFNNINASIFFEDSKENLWVGSNNGLYVFDRDSSNFNWYKMENGLPNNQVNGILEDNSKNLWLSTNKGISKFISGVYKPKDAIFKNYTIEDGLQGNEFKSRACYLGIDNRMYFGGNNGFNVFYPDSINDVINIPNVIFTNFLIANKNVEIGAEKSPLSKQINFLDEITLYHDQSLVFSIEYVLINYLSPRKNQYAYKLEGFDTKWNYVGNQRLATYTNLDPGEYTFNVKGAIGDNWNETAASINIIIIPPWWKTWWAYSLYILTISAVLVVIWLFQLNKRAMKHELMLEKQHAEKLEELSRAKSRFFANITHEFRSPLTLIIGPMKQFLAGEVKGNFSEIAKMTLRNSERLYQLINQILELTKLESGKVKLKTKQTDIIKFIKNIVEYFTPLAEKRKVSLKFFVDKDIEIINSELLLFIDRDKIEKVISNLLSNSLKFTPENGNIEVKIKKDHFTSENSDISYIEIGVIDDGIGIKEEEQDKIFDRFYQAVNPHSGDYESTGIGLALTKELVELHSGNIRVESVYNRGSGFYIRLPLGSDHLEPNQIIQENELNGIIYKNDIIKLDNDKSSKMNNQFGLNISDKRILTILIIDDNSDLREYISSSLQTEYKTITAKDGQEGLKKTINLLPDLILSDINMPKINGIELCNEIKKNELTNHIPIILLTVKASKDEKIEGLDTGADDYITKPFEISELKARIRNLIEQREKLKEKFNKLKVTKDSVKDVKSSKERFMDNVVFCLENNLSDPNFGVEELAKHMKLSRVQLYRKIRSITGQTAVEYIRTIRLEKAAQLLKLKHDNIGQIAYKVGFNNPSYFSNSFYKQFGEYPTEYAKKFE